MSAPTIPNLNSPHAIVLIGTDGVPYAATGGGAGGAAISAGVSSQNSGTVVFSNSNGVSFGMNNGVVTATVQPGAAAGIAAVQAGTQTQTSGTMVLANSNGVTFGMSGSSQVTASVASQSVQTQASGNIGGTGFATTTSAGSVIAGTNNTAGMTLAVPPFITTYAQSTQPVAVSGSNGSFAFSTATFGALNGLTFYTSNNSVVGSYTVPTTTQLVQTSASSLFEQTSATSAITSNAINTSVSTQFAGTATSFGGTNISGSMTLNSAGLSLSLSGGAGGGGGGIAASLSAGNTTGTLALVSSGTLYLAGGNNITLSQNGASVTISGGASASATNVTMYVTGNTQDNTSISMPLSSWLFNAQGAQTIGYSNGSVELSVPATSSLVGTGGISISTNGSTISVSYVSPSQTYLSYFEPQQRMGANTLFNASGSVQTGTVYINPFIAENYISAYRMMMLDSISTQASTVAGTIAVSESTGSNTGTASQGHTYTAVLFSRLSTGTNANSASLISFTSVSWSRTWGISGTTSNSTNASSASASVSTSQAMGFISNIDSVGGFTSGSTGVSGSTTSSTTTTNSTTQSFTFAATGLQPYFTGVRPLNVPLNFSLSPGEYWLGLQYSTQSGSGGHGITNVSVLGGIPELGNLSSSASIMYQMGLSANNTNTTNAQQGCGTLSGGTTASTTTAFPIAAISNRSGIQTWFNLMAASL